MDGFAVRRADVVGASAAAPVHLPIAASIAAGADTTSLAPLPAGAAARIMTGAPVPAGADGVIRVEDTVSSGDRVAIVNDRDTAGRANIRPMGEEIREGDMVFECGTSLTPAHLGVLASTGAARIDVVRQPEVVLLTGGDELTTLAHFDEVVAGRRIVSSTSYSLPALFAAHGAAVRTPPIIRDTLGDNVAAVTDAIAARPDLVVTTGGISVGDHDYTRRAMQQLGANIEFWRVRIRPGGPIGFGIVHGIPWLGLPGNPVSSYVTAMLFAIPLLRRLGGHGAWQHRWMRARMADHANTPGGLEHFLRVMVSVAADGVIEGRLAGAQGSNLLRVMAGAGALARIPQPVEHVEPGLMIDLLLLEPARWTSA